MPNSHSRGNWHRNSRKADVQNLFQSVDGNKIFSTDYWYEFDGLSYASSATIGTSLTSDALNALTKGQQALVSKQRKRSITLEGVFGRSRRAKSKLSQVPYRKLTYFLVAACQCYSNLVYADSD